MARQGKDRRPTEPTILRQQFGRMDDILQAARVPPNTRYNILLRLLLLKLFVEMHPYGWMLNILLVERPDQRDSAPVRFEGALKCVVANWRELIAFLPPDAPFEFDCRADALQELWRLLLPISIHTSSAASLQDFFMAFGPRMLKKELAQYFTPCELTKFIAQLVNPTSSDRIVDPACGTGDFLVAAHRVAAEQHGVDISHNLTGYDISPDAIQLARLNLLIHGIPSAETIVTVADDGVARDGTK